METILIGLSRLGVIAFVCMGCYLGYYLINGKDFTFKKKKEDTVSCDTCKCLLNKSDSYIVKRVSTAWSLIQEEYYDELFYCQKCKPNYTKEIDGDYYKELQVDIKGEPIGYKKK